MASNSEKMEKEAEEVEPPVIDGLDLMDAFSRIHSLMEGGWTASKEHIKVHFTGHNSLRKIWRSATSRYVNTDTFKLPSQVYESKDDWEKLLQDLDKKNGGAVDDESGAITSSSPSVPTKEEAMSQLSDAKLPAQALAQMAIPAKFGKGDKKMFDTSIRNALEIPGSKLPQDIFGTDGLIFKAANVDGLVEDMKPDGVEWECKLYKMHIYGVGGKFDEHMDTLHADNHVATLVIQLPSEYEGGTFTVKHRNEETTIGSVLKMDDDETEQGDANVDGDDHDSRAIVFFTDCPHTIAPVTKGWRAVIQYDIYETKASLTGGSENDEGEDDDHDEEYYDAEDYDGEEENGVHDFSVERSNGDRVSPYFNKEVKKWLHDNPKNNLGLALFHYYCIGALKDTTLRGEDRWTYEALAADKSLKISFRSLVMEARAETNSYNDIIDANCADFEGVRMARVITLQDILPDQYVLDEHKPPRPTKPIILLHEVGEPYDNDDGKVKTNMEELMIIRTEYTGNEQDVGDRLYQTACMVIELREEEEVD